MNLTKEQYQVLEAVSALLPYGAEYDALPDAERETIFEFRFALVMLSKKRQRENERTAKYIAEKRKTDKNYARKKA